MLEELKEYKRRAAAKADELGLFDDSEHTEEELEQKRGHMEVDVGVPHVQAIRARLSFISNICVASTLSISLDDINEIWTCFVGAGATSAAASGQMQSDAESVAQTGLRAGLGSLCEEEMESFMLLLRRATSGPDAGQLIDMESAVELYRQRMVNETVAPPSEVGVSQFDCLNGYFFSINHYLEKVHKPIGA